MLYSSFLLFRRSKKALADEKKQILYLILGFMLGAAGGATNFFLFYGIPIPPYGSFFVPVWVFFVGYGVVKYRALGIKVITTEFLVFLIWSFLLSRVFLAAGLLERIIDTILFLFVLVIGILLIGSVRQEVKQREKLEGLTNELKDLNQNLQQKVDEQTQEIRKAYEVEKKARIELEDLNKAKDQFLLATQHHLRTPLTIMKGYLSVLLSKKQELDWKTKEDYTEKTLNSTNRLIKLVNELLDISKLQVGKQPLNLQPTNIRHLIEDILKDLQAEISAKNLKVKILPENKEGWPLIPADSNKLRIALSNIIDNAVRYTPKGEIIIQGQITKDSFQISIQDTGIGINPEEIKTLFTRYFERGEQAQKLYTTGRGIGLFIAANIIKVHQGRIWAESEGIGKGTRFVVELGLTKT